MEYCKLFAPFNKESIMSTNISGEKRAALLSEINQIKAFIEQNANDENASRLLSYLGDLSKEISGKKYGLIFEEHREKIDEILEQNAPVFTEEKDLFIDGGGELNFLLEGDNLASLKLLEKTHRGKIDVIYIDPPYNTGNKDFIYDDDYVNELDDFKHSKWLSFIEKRLIIAKTLLREEGIIFISINDIEVAQLRLILDSIFGEKNYLAEIAWQCLDTIKNDAKYFSNNHEYILCYAKKIETLKMQGLLKGEKQRAYYKNYDNDPRGDYLLTPLHAKSGTEAGIYSYKFSNGQIWTPPKGTYPRFSKETLAKLDKEGRLYLDPNCKKTPQKKTYYSEVGDRMPAPSFWDYINYGSTRQSNKELADIIDKGIFQNPKPSKLITILIDLIANNSNMTILDFFAGSGTTGHAVLKLNAEDGGHRKFILCTNNENNICRDITYERIKTVITGKRKDGSKYSDGLPGSLKYFKTDFIPITEKMYYEYADELLLHVRELVELENAVNFDKDNSVAIVLDDDEMESFIDKVVSTSSTTTKTLYMGHDVLLSSKQERILKTHNIKVNVIPDYYYRDLAL